VESFNGRFRDEFLNIELFASLQEAKLLARAAPNRVQRLQTAFGSPGAYAPGSPPAMESGLITPLALIRTGAGMGVTS